MKRNIIFFTLFLISIVSGQETRQKDPNIELPEFVITGIEKVSLPILPKPKAEILTIISEDFIRPSFSPEELSISSLSEPVKKEINILDKAKSYDGKLMLGLGAYTVPTGKLEYGTTLNNGLIKGELWGKNVRAYVDDADVKTFGASVITSLFSDNNSDFLPGSSFKFGADYQYLGYKFFGSQIPGYQRDLHFGNFYFGYGNFPTENFKLNFKVDDRIFYVKDLDLLENNFNVNGFIETGLKEFTLAGNVQFSNYFTKTDSAGSSNFGFLKVNPYAVLNLSDHLTLRGGIIYAHMGSSNLFSPTASISLLFSKHVSFYGELRPDAVVLDPNALATKNRFYAISSIDPIMQKEKFNMKAAFKYEYETYFEIDAGMQYIDYENYFYFADTARSGFFMLDKVNAKSLSGFGNFLFHTGPNGVFYGGLILENLKAGDGNFIPYAPSLKINASYGYTFSNGLYVEPKINFFSHCYTDFENKERIFEFVDLAVKLEYKLTDNFNIFSDVTNILNHKNYFWRGYKEKSFDIVFGLNYRW